MSSANRSPVAVDTLLHDPAFPALRDDALRLTGSAFYARRERDLADITARRMAAVQAPDLTAYRRLLAGSDSERQAFAEGLTIGETYFFRFTEQFDALRTHILPTIIAENRERQERRLHIWSAACSIGAEPYSLSILLRREFAGDLAGWDVSILGTDLNERFLEQARSAVYSPWALRTLDEPERLTYFDREPGASPRYSLKSQYCEGVFFQAHNLLEAPPSHHSAGPPFDLILCRNVLIYFDDATIRKVVKTLVDALRPGGWLLLGHAEPGEFAEEAHLQPVRLPGAVAYRCCRTGDAPLRPLVLPAYTAPEAPAPFLAPEQLPTLPVLPWQPPVLLPLPLPSSRPPTPGKPATEETTPDAQPVRDVVRTQLDRGDAAGALKTADAALSAGGPPRTDPLLHLYRGLALEHLNRYAEAGEALRRALYLDRSLALAHYHLALLAERAGNDTQASRSLENATRLLESVLGREESSRDAADTSGLPLPPTSDVTAEALAAAVRARQAALLRRRGA